MSKAQRKRRHREAQKPIGRMKERLIGRIVEPCLLACFTCDRFVGHNHGCPGIKARNGDDEKELPAVSKVELPICHVDFRTGKMESPLDPHTGKLVRGQEKFYEVAAEGRQGTCSWVAWRKLEVAANPDVHRDSRQKD